MTHHFNQDSAPQVALQQDQAELASGTSRRDFLSAAGALVVSVASGSLPAQALAQATANAAASSSSAAGTTLATVSAIKPALKAEELDSWVAIQPDSHVVAYYGQVD